MFFEKIAPKKFLCYYSLRCGCIVAAIVLLLQYVALFCVSVVHAVNFSRCNTCEGNVKLSTQALLITYAVYMMCMTLVNAWFWWGIETKKSTVIVAWVMLEGISLVQHIFIMIIEVCLSMDHSDRTIWQLMLSLTIIALCIEIYLWFIGYGYFLQLRAENPDPNTTRNPVPNTT